MVEEAEMVEEVDERCRKKNRRENKKYSCFYVVRVLTCLATLCTAGVCSWRLYQHQRVADSDDR
jgi:hypothetical protein